MGRTGFAGRGLLPRWGPNHMLDCVITRWSQTTPRTMEVLLLRQPISTYALPGDFIGPGDAMPAFLQTAIAKALQSTLSKVEQVRPSAALSTAGLGHAAASRTPTALQQRIRAVQGSLTDKVGLL